MEKHVLLGNVIEKQAVSVIQMYFTQRIINEVSVYCIQDWKDLSYQQILSTKLTIIGLSVLGGRKRMFS